MIKDNLHLFCELREKHPEFVYENFKTSVDKNSLFLEYTFSMSGGIVFRPTLRFEYSPLFNPNDISEGLLENIAFHIGLVELISYWKTACPPDIIIKPYKLDKRNINWWKNLYFNGLGEFFFLNNIKVENPDKLLNISNHTNSNKIYACKSKNTSDRILIPVGGGKDSIVTLETLKNHAQTIPMVINHRAATKKTIEKAGYTPDNTIVVNRTLDQNMIDLNKKGYLNGHTPFSALLAFVSLLASAGTKSKHIALSNESSANESTIPGTSINHQYSKSYNFEKKFREYVADNISNDINYFSFLRPLNELQIGKLFAGYDRYHHIFKSCNAGSKTDNWCCKCPKCLFVYIILSPFLAPEKMIDIFGENLLNKEDLKNYFDELTGISKLKPFECVGTIEEVNAALCITINKYYCSEYKPSLIKHYLKSGKYENYKNHDKILLNQLSKEHFVPDELFELLKLN